LVQKVVLRKTLSKHSLKASRQALCHIISFFPTKMYQ
jgi:hypothetical protein